MEGGTKFWTYVGVDGSQIYEEIISDDNILVFLIGYITQGAVFLTTGVNIDPASPNVWTEKDLSATCPSGIIAFIEMDTYSGTYRGGIRKKGSSLDHRGQFSCQVGICALDSGQKCEVYAGTAPPSVGFHVIGYAQWAGA